MADLELKMEIGGLLLDPTSNLPIVILREELAPSGPEKSEKRVLPIWIGVFEANAIALRIDGFEPARPMTHDLLLSTFRELGAVIDRIVISDLKETTFYAVIHLVQGDRHATIDSRPSDAIALALRADAPIFVLSSVLDKAQAADRASEVSDEEQLKKWLEEISPEDLGKYTM